ncbi:MAG: hypothetical protein JXO44_00130 [Clostridia bacterium]|nr:hypothetical protein [Clostridia bacterium]
MKNKYLNNRGSLTAEAAISFTCVLMLIIFLMTFIGMTYSEAIMEEALAEASLRVRAELPFLVPSEDVIGKDYILQALLKKDFINALEKRSDQRIRFTEEDPLLAVDVSDSLYCDEASGMMKLSVKAQWPLIYFKGYEKELECVLYCKPFSTFREPLDFLETQEIQIVYLATNPTVYHTNPNCFHLKNRKKRAVELSSLEGEYRECKDCQKGRSKPCEDK